MAEPYSSEREDPCMTDEEFARWVAGTMGIGEKLDVREHRLFCSKCNERCLAEVQTDAE